MEIYRCAAPVLSSMANCVVPTSMLIIGCLLSGSPLIDVLKKPILYLITLLRCLVMPLIAAVILRFTGWNRTVCLCIVMVLGCSVAHGHQHLRRAL